MLHGYRVMLVVPSSVILEGCNPVKFQRSTIPFVHMLVICKATWRVWCNSSVKVNAPTLVSNLNHILIDWVKCSDRKLISAHTNTLPLFFFFSF